MRTLMVCLIAWLVLSGCAARVITSNPRSVVVHSEDMDTAKSTTLADKECARYQKYARLTSRPTYWLREYVFDCV